MKTRPSFIGNADWNALLSKYSEEELDSIYEKILNDYPVQYLIGDVDFLNTKINVDENVLIPRYETELLVSKLIDYIKKFNLEDTNILDLCTGSGCISISLKKYLPNSSVYGVDISKNALNVAKSNASLNYENVDFLEKDVLNDYDYNKKFSVLVSNPPYLKLDEEVSKNTKYEPSIALYPGDDDIIFYKKILDNASKILEKKNIIAFEIGMMQGEEILEYAKNKFKDAYIEIQKDFNDRDRFIFIFNNCE